ncbi:MAG: permease prefix domain 1-containing protein [Bacilli bacterium]
MNDRLVKHIETLFADAPQTKQTFELKEEILQNSIEKYNDLITDGKSEESAFNIVISSIGDISQLVYDLNNPTGLSSNETEHYIKRSAIATSISIGLYILSAIPILWLQNEAGVIISIIIISIATCILVYKNITNPKYIKEDDTIVEDFKEWRHQSNSGYQSYKAISSSINAIATVAFILISFSTGYFHITWVIFVIAYAVKQIIKAIFQLKGML